MRVIRIRKENQVVLIISSQINLEEKNVFVTVMADF